jgi:hypothetical protein
MNIHWQNHSDAKRALSDLGRLEDRTGERHPVLRHALQSILNRASCELGREAMRKLVWDRDESEPEQLSLGL